jgi:hypothetical protein
MQGITTITINKQAGRETKARAQELRLSVKEYAESALSYFYSRGINPVDHCPSLEFETNELIRQVGKQIIGFLQQQEETVLKEQSEALQIALREMLKSSYLLNAIIMILIENFYSNDVKKKEVEAEIREYVNQNLQNFDNPNTEL